MPLETPARSRPQLTPELALPPPFTPVRLREVGDAFAHATSIAAEQGAGTLVYVGRFDLAEFAVVLEPDEPLRQRAARFLCRHGGAGRCAGDATRRRKSRSRSTGRMRSRSIGGLVGGGRLAWPQGRRRGRAAGLAGVRRHDPHRLDDRYEPGLQSACHGAGGGGLHRCRCRRTGRELRAPSDGRDRCLAGERLRRRREGAIWQRLPREQGPAPRHRRERRSAGAPHGQGRGRAQAAAAALAQAPSWLDPEDAEGRARETVAHHPARSVRHVRVRARRRARRMGGVGRLRVLECGSGDARRQGALGVPRRISRRRFARLVDAGADRRGERSRPRRGWSSSWRSNWSRTSARRISRRRAPRRRRKSRSRPRSAIIRRHADRGASHLRGRRGARGVPHAASARRTEADARVLVSRGRRRGASPASAVDLVGAGGARSANEGLLALLRPSSARPRRGRRAAWSPTNFSRSIWRGPS